MKSFLSNLHTDYFKTKNNPVYTNDEIELIASFFDHEFYKKQVELDDNQDLLKHFLYQGYKDNLNPCEYFDSKWYQNTFNVDKEIINPFLHFCKYGVFEDKNPSRAFDLVFYLKKYPDVKNSGLNPLFHYLKHGRNEGRFISELRARENELQQKIQLFKRKKKTYFNLAESNFKVAEDSNYFSLVTRERGEINNIKIDKKIKLISLDIWDTVLKRKVFPDEVKYCSARFLLVNYYWLLKPGYRSILALFKARILAENNASLTDDFEYKYSDAITLWLPIVLRSGCSGSKLSSIKKELLEHELKAESRSSQLDIGIVDFIQKNNKEKIIFTSDFYMSKSFIFKLLTKHKISKYFISGYSSSDFMKNKRNGELFLHVLKDFEVQPNEVLHIGDNKYSDIETPSKLGINTFHYSNEQEKDLNLWLKQAFDNQLNQDIKLHQNRILALLGHKEELIEHSKKEIVRLGFRFSVVVVGFILNVIEEAKKVSASKIYFFTREGIFLKEIYDLIIENDPYYSTYPDSEILEVSRLSTFAPSLNGFDVENLMRIWNQYSIQSPKAFVASLNLDHESSRSVFEEAGFKYEEEIEFPWENKSFIDLLKGKKFRKIIPSINNQRELLLSYLSNKGLNKSKKSILVVDIGWRGSIQDNLSHLVTEHIHGCYLGLCEFLNPQPNNVSKSGWLFDFNKPAQDFNISDVGPIEMLFNSPGGSTIKYESATELEVENIRALKIVDDSEDGVYEKYTDFFQQGIKLAVPDVIDYIAIHSMVSNDLVSLSRSILEGVINNPPIQIATAFYTLNHNEVFGTGEYQKVEENADLIQNLSEFRKSKLHFKIFNILKNCRWENGLLKLLKENSKITKNNLTHSPTEFYKEIYIEERDDNKFKVGIFSPKPIPNSGGHRTIANLARKLSEAGCEVYFFIEEADKKSIDIVKNYLKNAAVFIDVGWFQHLEFDMAFATIAHSAQFVANMPNVEHKAYLVQDFEAWFNPVGDAYTIAENSYTYNLLHFTVGDFLSHLLQNQYNARTIASGLGVNTDIYRDNHQQRENAICFLYQPEKPRRNPNLGIDALRLVKEKRPDIKIYIYGSDAPIYLDFEAENLGLIHNLTEINNLYNKCKVGLCISMTNPSRIPFELMACGVVPVDVYRYNNLIDYPSKTIKLAYQSSNSIAKAILDLLGDNTDWLNVQKKCKDFVKTRSLDWEMDVFVNNSLLVMSGKHPVYESIIPSYDEEPILDPSEKDQAKAFCDWHRKLAMYN